MTELPQLEDLIPLWPGAAAAALCLLVSALAGRKGHARAALIAGGLALPLCYSLSYWRLVGIPEWPANAGSERMAYAAPAFGLLGTLALLLEKRGTAARLVLVSASIALVYWLFEPRAEGGAFLVDAGQALLIVGGIVLFQSLLEDLVRIVNGASLTLGLGLALGVFAQIVFGYGSGLLAQMLGALSFGLVVSAPALLIAPERRLPAAVVGGVTGALAGLGLDAYFLSADATPPGEMLLLLLASPLLVLVTRLPKVRDLGGWFQALLHLVLLLALLGYVFQECREALPQPSADELELDDLYGEGR